MTRARQRDEAKLGSAGLCDTYQNMTLAFSVGGAMSRKSADWK